MLQIKKGMLILNYLRTLCSKFPVTNLIKKDKQTMWKTKDTYLIHFPFHNVQVRSAAVRSVRSIFIVHTDAGQTHEVRTRERDDTSVFIPKSRECHQKSCLGQKHRRQPPKKKLAIHSGRCEKEVGATCKKSPFSSHASSENTAARTRTYTRWKKPGRTSYLLHTHAKIMIVRLIKLGAQLHARGWNYAASAWEPASVIPTE